MILNKQQMSIVSDAFIDMKDSVEKLEVNFGYDRITILLSKDFDIQEFKRLRNIIEDRGWKADLESRIFTYMIGVPSRGERNA